MAAHLVWDLAAPPAGYGTLYALGANIRRDGAWRSLVSALVWGTRGPEFKSRRPDSHIILQFAVFLRISATKPSGTALEKRAAGTVASGPGRAAHASFTPRSRVKTLMRRIQLVCCLTHEQRLHPGGTG